MALAGKIEPVNFSAPFTSNNVAACLDLGPPLCVKACPHCGYQPTRNGDGVLAMTVTVDGKCGKCGGELRV